MSTAFLILEDGTLIKAKHAGVEKDVFGEIVFNTSMSGYEEAFTDPSYSGQILLMTYPLIGNYGIRKKNFESSKVQIRGFISSLLPLQYRHQNLDLKNKKTRDNEGNDCRSPFQNRLQSIASKNQTDATSRY
jgi:carbamoylphosphate synthase small subunit